MAIEIVSAGINKTGMLVDSDGRALVRGVVEGPLEQESEINGNAGYWNSTLATGGSDVEVISIQNTTAKKLHITRCFLGTDTAGIWTFLEVTSGTPAGTPITHVNPNFTSGTSNTSTSFGNAAVTGSVAGDTLAFFSQLAVTGNTIFFEGSIILGQNLTFAVSFSASATIHITVIGFWAENTLGGD